MTAKTTKTKTNKPTKAEFDIVIVGGGLVGISLAYALSRLNPAPKVALIEAYDYAPLSSIAPPGFDSRTVALSYSSRQIFSGLNLWPAIAEQACPISTIHISDRGHLGMTRLTAHEQNVEALGYVVENRVLGKCLLKDLSTLEGLSLFTPAKVIDLDFDSSGAEVKLEIDVAAIDAADTIDTIDTIDTKTLSLQTKLVIAADGTESFVRQHVGISQRQWAYHQSAIITNIAIDRSHNNIAYERFTQSGPMALLPLSAYEQDAHRYGLVWTVPEQNVEQIMQLDDADFARELQKRFGRRIGNITRIGHRVSYPLGLNHIDEHVRHRLAFIGNAAHTLHPVAGQGFNLGLRDVAAIVEVIKTAQAEGVDIGDLTTLNKYAKWRSHDHNTTMMFTDALVRVFSNNFPPLVMVRNAGLMAMDMFAPLRKRLTRHAMGYLGKASMLARGLGLE